MHLLVNDLSLHGQFREKAAFRDALTRLMTMRNVAQRLGCEVCCHRALLNAKPMTGMTMQQALGQLTSNEQRAILGWLTRHGPFWDDLRQHAADEYLECRGEIVTDSAVGEAAFRTFHGVDCGLVSIAPSDWDYLARGGDLGVGRSKDYRTSVRTSTTGAMLSHWKKNFASLHHASRSWADITKSFHWAIHWPDFRCGLL